MQLKFDEVKVDLSSLFQARNFVVIKLYSDDSTKTFKKHGKIILSSTIPLKNYDNG